jgi:hypothetical protein
MAGLLKLQSERCLWRCRIHRSTRDIHLAIRNIASPETACRLFEELIDGIRKTKAVGVNVAPFVSFRIILNPGSARYGVAEGHDDWTYHPELIPQFEPYYTHNFEGTDIPDGNPLWEQDALATFTDWVKRGITSIDLDQFIYTEKPGEKPALIRTVEAVRASARQKDSQSTFSSESCTDLELDGSVLDYTWNWVFPHSHLANWDDKLDAGPLVSVLRAPRFNCNIDSSYHGGEEMLCRRVVPECRVEPGGSAQRHSAHKRQAAPCRSPQNGCRAAITLFHASIGYSHDL